jgi:hypothetical protein
MRFILQFHNNDELKVVEKDNVPITLYLLKASVPYKFNRWDVVDQFDEFNNPNYITKLKKEISKIESCFPLFDIHTRNTYLVKRKNVYDYVVNRDYRRIDKKLYTTLVRNIRKYSDEDYFYFPDILKKLKKGIVFIDNYDHVQLKETYKKIIRSLDIPETQLKKEFYIITTCISHSFLPYIVTSKPYYTKTQLEKLGLNMKLELNEVDNTDEVCKIVRKNDVKSWMILKHQKHIEKMNGKFLLEFYSMFGAYFMNEYLRGNNTSGTTTSGIKYKNIQLEKQIKGLWKIINSSPKLDRKYVIYRFLHNDDHLKHLKKGDTYTSNSFMSCTRNPFYEAKEHVFGYNLIKINLPEGEKGVLLFMETYSLFKNEQEIIMAPLSKFKVDEIQLQTAGSHKILYHHTNKKYQDKIEKIYEFTYMGSSDAIKIDVDYKKPSEPPLVNFMKFHTEPKEFAKTHLNEIKKFKTVISNKEYVFNCQWYDSTESYNDYFHITTKKGLYIYNQNDDGKITLLIEIGKIISVNYYHKFSENEDVLSEGDLLLFVSELAHCFKIGKVHVHPNYKSCKHCLQYSVTKEDVFKYSADITSYSVDLYDYLKYGKKRFDKVEEVDNKFKYKSFDGLGDLDVNTIINKQDHDNVHKIYRKEFIPISKPKTHNIKSFYVFMMENYFYDIKLLEDKIVNRSKLGDVFKDNYYILNPSLYLYNRKLVNKLDKMGKDVKSYHVTRFREYMRDRT